MTGGRAGAPADVPGLLAEVAPTVLARTVLAVAAMHEPDPSGRCRCCQRGRLARWRRRPAAECQTRRVIVAELRTGAGPHWTPA